MAAMPYPLKPRPNIASLVASAAWLGPWIVFLLLVEDCNNDRAVGCGLFLAFIPVGLIVGALIWRVVGALLRDGSPPLKRFTIHGALLAAGFVLVWEIWKLWGFWDAPGPPVRWSEPVGILLITVGALALTALPAAALWWWLAVRPAAASAESERQGAP